MLPAFMESFASAQMHCHNYMVGHMPSFWLERIDQLMHWSMGRMGRRLSRWLCSPAIVNVVRRCTSWTVFYLLC